MFENPFQYQITQRISIVTKRILFKFVNATKNIKTVKSNNNRCYKNVKFSATGYYLSNINFKWH